MTDFQTGFENLRKMQEPPAEISEALLSIQRKIPQQLGHDSKNNHQNYGYVSIDKYYQCMRPLLNDEGLIILPQEVTSKMSQDGSTYMVTFEFFIVHESGKMWHFPIRRSVTLKYTGAQTSGMALSYAEKFFMRTVFKMATGEADLEQSEPMVSNDADALPQPKTGQPIEIDYDLDGPPYRVFDHRGAIESSFTDVMTWGVRLKIMIDDEVKGQEVLQKNLLEMERIERDIEQDEGLHHKRKKAIIDRIHNMKGTFDE